ncbi:MAG: response regulator [Deltaproteobacteria bacterium]|nr:response regulator [Deltaproteobacteria bacterium]
MPRTPELNEGAHGEHAPCRSILVVEDDPDISETIQDLLEQEGYSVTTAANGKEGLEKLGHMERPCLILLDLMMPVMNGLEFLAARGENDVIATIPVVVLTAYGQMASQVPTSEVAGIVKKPVELESLINSVRTFCGPPC